MNIVKGMIGSTRGFYLLLVCFVVLLGGCSTQVTKSSSQISESKTVETDTAEEALKLAHLLRNNGRYQAAYEVYEKMDEKGQLEGPFVLEYASLSASILSASEAIALYKRAQGELGKEVSDSQQQAICVGLGRAYLELAQLNKAKEQFQCALEASPQSVMALNGLGVIASMNGDVSTAQENLQGALDIAPSNEIVLNNLALSWLSSGEFQKAISLLKTKQSSQNMSTRLNLALAYVLIDREDMARELLLKNISRNKTEAILDSYVTSKYRIKNGSDISAEILALTNSPFSLKDE
ncbi:tetratricopeptide repeat protein [Marinomonas lutimaris]|uniref:tetratricopeptide repeat protein n=1 Tax=Marinomonas lutimaris TaxID=2846746 RepID=UPI001CA56AF8|nr:tetratricopeptide repeat protein [Marinomonas lutimaris]